jgi:peptide/nickel transport system permease protein
MSDTLRRLLRHRLFVTGLVLLGIVVTVAVLAPILAASDPNRLAMRSKFLPPSLDHPFGTDNFGRSQLSRVVWGARLSLVMGLSVVALNAVFGTLLGAVSGYFRRLDNMLMRFNDALMAFPAIILALAITAALGASMINAVIAIAVVYIPRTARIVRASVLVVR